MALRLIKEHEPIDDELNFPCLMIRKDHEDWGDMVALFMIAVTPLS